VSEDSSESVVSEPVSAPSDLVVDCSADEVKTRQEFYHDSLVSTIMARAGVPNGLQFVAGEVDYDLDLGDAYAIKWEQQRLFSTLPPAARRFGSFLALGEALASGRVTLADLGISAAEAGGGSPSEAPAGSAAPTPPVSP